jgi:hypothetical protein
LVKITALYDVSGKILGHIDVEEWARRGGHMVYTDLEETRYFMIRMMQINFKTAEDETDSRIYLVAPNLLPDWIADVGAIIPFSGFGGGPEGGVVTDTGRANADDRPN